jgi:hypothetical protein
MIHSVEELVLTTSAACECWDQTFMSYRHNESRFLCRVEYCLFTFLVMRLLVLAIRVFIIY